jgi:hypothetical protein
MLIGFCPADNESATEEFLVVQFLHGAFCFLDALHLHKSKTFRALVVPVTYDLRILHVSDAVEQFKEIALGCVEGQVPDVKTGRRHFYSFRLPRRARWLRPIARLSCRFLFVSTVAEKFGNPLPECLFLRFRCSLPVSKAFVVPSASAPTARAVWASSG